MSLETWIALGILNVLCATVVIIKGSTQQGTDRLLMAAIYIWSACTSVAILAVVCAALSSSPSPIAVGIYKYANAITIALSLISIIRAKK